MNQNFKPAYLWVDLEMTGLDVRKQKIIEFACILSDQKFTHFEDGPQIVIHQDISILEKMDQWNTTHHKASGLYDKVLASKISTEEAEKQILDYLISKKISKKQLYIAGNSVHMDRLFICMHMPALYDFLHYRILDVSCLKLLKNTYYPEINYQKKGAHRALDDIRESIGELKLYLSKCFSRNLLQQQSLK